MWKRGKVPLAQCLQGILALKTGFYVERLLKTFSFLKTDVKSLGFSQGCPIVIHMSDADFPHSYSQAKMAK